ncbi:murein hydrolase activator EnvC family protein [Desulforhopalus singaporensis]|uniref:Septal ring factor EnvC, activator of murein hydrolases AmiA and AmiB n=1 Tax=Desulforhopalus singaporensis TaxID=91360 RepID=A0A1H0QNQ0_9BACT|nr:peptidoglycan DD-metalloendopeptidase family protein [Desulforhopalus singaporensis]SDP18366.1 Septal ring factor EnvC, activator of murein hydrolases AmiA and AmiB [Desulforhopalus singaporensis]
MTPLNLKAAGPLPVAGTISQDGGGASRRIPVRLNRLLLALLFVAATCHWSGAEQDEVARVRSNVQRLQESISRQEQKISESRQEEQSILAELERLEQQISGQQEKLDAIKLKVLRQELLIEDQQGKLYIIKAQKDTVEKHLQKRITAYYTMGDIGILNVSFSTRSLPELLSFREAFDHLINYDREVLVKYKKTMDQQQRAKQALELEKEVLEDFLSQARQEKDNLEQSKVRKSDLLVRVRTQEKLHQQAVDELNEASRSLVDSIVAIKNQHEILEQGFIANKGSLSPPANGVIVTIFGQKIEDKFGITGTSSGIEIRVPDSTPVVSVSEGEVIFSDYLRGYGNTVIIHHGYQYYTVTSRLEKLGVSKGIKVAAHEKIGIAGDTATLFNRGIYFEIRHGRQSLDPLLWLNPDKMVLSQR